METDKEEVKVFASAKEFREWIILMKGMGLNWEHESRCEWVYQRGKYKAILNRSNSMGHLEGHLAWGFCRGDISTLFHMCASLRIPTVFEEEEIDKWNS